MPVIGLGNYENIIQLAHWGTGTYSAVVWSSDGKLIAAAAALGIYLYDASTLKQVSFINSSASIECIAFSPDGQTLAAGSWDNTVRLWQVSDGKLLQTLVGNPQGGSLQEIQTVAFSPDGTSLASGSLDGTILIWHMPSGQLQMSLSGPYQGVYQIVFSPDRQMLVSTGDKGTQFWDLSDGKLLRTLDGGLSLAFSPDGKVLILGGFYFMSIIRVSDGIILNHLGKSEGEINSVAFSPDGKILASYQPGTPVQLWRVSDWTLLRAMKGTAQGFGNLAFSPDGQTLVLSDDQSNTLRLWQVSDGTLLQTLKLEDTGPGENIALSPAGQILAMLMTDGVELRRISDWVLLNTLVCPKGWYTGKPVFSPNGQTLATPSYDPTTNDEVILLWRVSDGALLQSMDLQGASLISLTFSPDGQSLAFGTDTGNIQIRRVSDGKLHHVLVGHTDVVFCLAFSPDGQTLASCSKDSTVRLWRVSDGKLLHVLKRQGDKMVYGASVSFSPDGQTLATDLGLWHVIDGSFIRDGYGGVFTPDGQLWILGGGGGLKILLASDGTLLRTLGESEKDVVAYDPNGRLFATTNWVGAISLWGISPTAPIMPTPTFTPTPTLTPIPVPTWEILPQPPLYDDFESASLDSFRWQPADPNSASQFTYLQKDGALVLEGQTKNAASYFAINLTEPNLRRIDQVNVFEAQMEVPKRSSGTWSFITMRLGTGLSDQRWWTTECLLTNLASDKPYFGCDVNTFLNGQNTYEHYSQTINIKFGQWYTIRIELNPANAAIQWYLDGKLVESYMAKDASALLLSQFSSSFAIYTDKMTSLTAEIDNVRITGGPQP